MPASLFCTGAHDLFDPATVIPRTVEKDDLPRCRKERDVTLEIPLPPLAPPPGVFAGQLRHYHGPHGRIHQDFTAWARPHARPFAQSRPTSRREPPRYSPV